MHLSVQIKGGYYVSYKIPELIQFCLKVMLVQQFCTELWNTFNVKRQVPFHSGDAMQVCECVN